jgi:hypothetical protein
MLLENRTKIVESAVHGFAIPKQIATAHKEASSWNICIDNREWLFIRGLLPRAKNKNCLTYARFVTCSCQTVHSHCRLLHCYLPSRRI